MKEFFETYVEHQEDIEFFLKYLISFIDMYIIIAIKIIAVIPLNKIILKTIDSISALILFNCIAVSCIF